MPARSFHAEEMSYYHGQHMLYSAPDATRHGAAYGDRKGAGAGTLSAPPNRESIADGISNRAGAAFEGLKTVHRTVVEDSIHAAFEFYRVINPHLRAPPGA